MFNYIHARMWHQCNLKLKQQIKIDINYYWYISNFFTIYVHYLMIIAGLME